MVGAAQALIKAGARSIDAVITHAVLSPGAMERLLKSPIKRFVLSDTLAGLAANERLIIQPVSTVIALALKDTFGNLCNLSANAVAADSSIDLAAAL
jgi:phosphoribosylpyrophosphate synthetase